MKKTYLKRRKALGLTRENVASASGVSFSTIVRMENGKHISTLAARAIEDALCAFEAQRASPKEEGVTS